MKSAIRILLTLVASLVLANSTPAQQNTSIDDVANQISAAVDAPATGSKASAAGDLVGEDGLQLSTAVEIALVLTVLSLLPAILISLTSFTRIVIVLSFVRRSLAVQELPPNPVLIGLALFLTMFVMGPVFKNVYEDAYVPYRSGEIAMDEAAGQAWSEMRGFLVNNTRQDELDLFVEMADIEPVEGAVLTRDDLPFRVVVPAFVLSELKTAFQMGFLLFLPFLVIDLVVASVLISMGMFMLPPVMISTPFKILLFVLVDGWRLVCESLLTSFIL